MEKKQSVKYEDFITIPLSLLSTEVQKSIMENISFKDDEKIDKFLCNGNCPHYHKRNNHTPCDLSSIDLNDSCKSTKLPNDIQKGIDFVFNRISINELSKKAGIVKSKLKDYKKYGFTNEIKNKNMYLKNDVFKIATVLNCHMKHIMTSEKFENYRWWLIEERIAKRLSTIDLAKIIKTSKASISLTENGDKYSDKYIILIEKALSQL